MDYQKMVEMELEGLYRACVLEDMHRIIDLYEQYDGAGQDWEVSRDLDYTPTKKRTNIIKKLIKEEARFLFGKPPEITLQSGDGAWLGQAQAFLDKTLVQNSFSEKIIKAARDCFVGKRVALKVGVGSDQGIVISFRPALEFVFETADEDADKLKAVVFFHGINNEEDRGKQQIWRQKYAMQGGRCLLWEGVYDGYGQALETWADAEDTGLTFIPVRIIVNDGLSGDLFGESDVEPLVELQTAYNRLTSDDIDALKFNMFPQTVAVDAMEKSLADMMIAPGALVDLQTDVTAGDGRQAKISKLESAFGYDGRLENTLNRIKSEMYELLNIPLVTPSELRGFVNSGKAMKALYWQLVTRCEEKFATWRPALCWMARAVLDVARPHGLIDGEIPEDLSVSAENIYPLAEEEFEEKELDKQLVEAKLMSRKSYLEKWNKGRESGFSEQETAQIQSENERG